MMSSDGRTERFEHPLVRPTSNAGDMTLPPLWTMG